MPCCLGRFQKKLAKKKGAISKIAKKLLPRIKKADREKLKTKTPGNEQA